MFGTAGSASGDGARRAALALEVPHSLAELPPGLNRDLERLRVEDAVRAAGLELAPRKRQDMP